MGIHDYLEAQADKESLAWKLHEAHRQLIDRHEQQRREKELEDRITERVLQRILVKIKDEATPAIRELRAEIDRMIKG